MKFTLLFAERLSEIIEMLEYVSTKPSEWIGTAIVTIASAFLSPLSTVIYIFHEITLKLLLFAPYPGSYEEEATNEIHIFTSPTEGSTFDIMQSFMSGTIEPIALFFVFFSIIVILFLRVFDVVIDDIGINIQEAKKRLFIAPILIVLWIPFANLILYFSYGMTQMISGITIEKPMDDPGDLELIAGNEINVLSYIETLVPETDGSSTELAYDINLFFGKLALAYLAALPALFLYLISMFLSIFRFIGLHLFYILGPIALMLWAFNWRDLGQLGGTAIRFFVVLSLFPIVVAFLNMMTPLLFVLLGDVMVETMGEVIEEGGLDAIMESSDGSEELGLEDLMQIDDLLAIVFIILTPLFMGLLPWGIVIGFNKALKMSVAGVGVAGGLAAIGGLGAVMGAKKGIEGVAQAGEMATDGVSGDAAGTAMGMSTSMALKAAKNNKRATAKQLGSNLRTSLSENKDAVTYGIRKKFKNTNMGDVEKSMVESGVLDNRFGTFGDTMQKGLKTDLKAKDKIKGLQGLKERDKLQHKQGYATKLSADIPLDENGDLDVSGLSGEERDRAIIKDMLMDAEIGAVANKMGESDMSDEAKYELMTSLWQQEEKTPGGNKYSQFNPHKNFSIEDAENIPDRVLAEEYYNAIEDPNENIEDYFQSKDVRDSLDDAARDVSRKDITKQMQQKDSQKYAKYDRQIEEYREEIYADTDRTTLQNELQGHLYDSSEVYQKDFADEFEQNVIDDLGDTEIIRNAIKNDEYTGGKGALELMKQWQKNGGDRKGLEEVLSRSDFDESIADGDEFDKLYDTLEESVIDISASLDEKEFDIGVNIDGDITGDDIDGDLQAEIIESTFKEYNKSVKSDGVKKSSLDNAREQQIDFIQDNINEIYEMASDDSISESEIEGKVSGTVIEDLIDDTIENHINEIEQNVGFEVSSPDNLDLSTKIDLTSSVDGSLIEEEIEKQLEHIAYINNRDINTESIENLTETVSKITGKVASETVEGVSREQIEQVENKLNDLKPKHYDSLIENVDDDMVEFLNTVQESQQDMFDELDSKTSQERQKLLNEIQTIDVQSFEPRIDFDEMGINQDNFNQVVAAMKQKVGLQVEEIDASKFEWLDEDDLQNLDVPDFDGEDIFTDEELEKAKKAFTFDNVDDDDDDDDYKPLW